MKPFIDRCKEIPLTPREPPPHPPSPPTPIHTLKIDIVSHTLDYPLGLFFWGVGGGGAGLLPLVNQFNVLCHFREIKTGTEIPGGSRGEGGGSLYHI